MLFPSVRRASLGPVFLSVVAACSVEPTPGGPGLDPTPPLEDDLVPEDQKLDTGYLSTLAAELEGRLRGQLIVDDTPDNRAVVYGEETEELEKVILEQIKFGKNQQNAQKVHLNLENGSLASVTRTERDGKLVVDYELVTETLIKYSDLPGLGVASLEDLQNQRFEYRTPADPRDLVARAGERCAEGFDAGHLEDWNYFYYFKPDKEGCDIPVTMGSFEIRNLLPTSNPYPEYDLLVADGVISVVAFFGAAEYDDEVSEWDWGMREHAQFVADLLLRGFSEAGIADEASGKGRRYARTVGELTETVDVISPRDLKALKLDSEGLFGRMVRDREIVLYMGHSFYGSLGVLKEPATYAPGRYQIFFMGSCWSYEYYTKQIFRQKATTDDPQGWALADVINDTEVGWFHNNAEFARIILTNVLRGAETGGIEGDRRYHWQNIIAAMNMHAIQTQQATGTETHELMGVSGVRSNRYDPAGTAPPPSDEPWTRTELVLATEHPVAHDATLEFPVSSPAASEALRIHFARIDTEAGYDKVEVLDADGSLVASYDGVHEDLLTPEILGGSATIRVLTDSSVESWGFEVDYILTGVPRR